MKDRLIDTTKIFTFDSAHKLENYDGDCKYLHGHTYKLEVTVRGVRDYRGMVIDFKDLKTAVKEEIISVLDHRYLNEIFDFNPTCENMVEWIFEKLDGKLSLNDSNLQKITLWETPTSYASIEREQYYA
jgi:6-pyruvoyltetrahydropterin/6-carboxytetrahydropterin synthase